MPTQRQPPPHEENLGYLEEHNALGEEEPDPYNRDPPPPGKAGQSKQAVSAPPYTVNLHRKPDWRRSSETPLHEQSLCFALGFTHSQWSPPRQTRNPYSHARSLVAAAAEFEVLAQTWGLFGGALAPAPTRNPETLATARLPELSSRDGSDRDAPPRQAVVEKMAGNNRFHRDGGARVPGVNASLPLRAATPPLTSVAGHLDEAPNEPEAHGSSPRPPSPMTPAPASVDYCDHGHDHEGNFDDVNGSPELTMTFIEETGHGQDAGPVGATAGRPVQETVGGEPQTLLSG